MTAGRKPGSLCRFSCCVCGVVELTTGGSDTFRCGGCRAAGLFASRSMRITDWTGKDRASRQVATAIAAGRLPRPNQLKCADCPAPAIEYEHRDYNKPLQVDPICRRCNLLRGPAIPLAGSVERLLEHGVWPYRRPDLARKLCRTMGRPEIADSVPSRRLTLEDWRALWPLIARPADQPAEASHAN